MSLQSAKKCLHTVVLCSSMGTKTTRVKGSIPTWTTPPKYVTLMVFQGASYKSVHQVPYVTQIPLTRGDLFNRYLSLAAVAAAGLELAAVRWMA